VQIWKLILCTPILSLLLVGIIYLILFRFCSSYFLSGLWCRTCTAVVVAVIADRHLELLAGLEHSCHFFWVSESSHAHWLDVWPTPLLRQRTDDLHLDRRGLLFRCLKRINYYYENKMSIPFLGKYPLTF